MFFIVYIYKQRSKIKNKREERESFLFFQKNTFETVQLMKLSSLSSAEIIDL